jgi:xylan 1,4-beta-xylosidase
MHGLRTILSCLRPDTLRLMSIPLALAASGCGDAVTPIGAGGGTAGAAGPSTAGTSGGGGAPATAGSGSGSGAATTGGGGTGTSGSGSAGGPLGGSPVVETVECQGPFSTDDVGAANYKVTAGTSSLGALPHFWTTFGLGRIGLYLDQASLDANHQAQDKQNAKGAKWSEVLKQQTVDAVANLELKSVRAHGLFHDDVGIYREDASGNAVYDFSRSDKIFDFLVENTIAPIIELASMPSALAMDPSQTVFDWKMIVSPPKDYGRWQALVNAFVAHSVEKYGADVVNSWYFEVWNEPECCGNKFWKGSLDDYFKLYDASAAGVRAALPNGRMGGPVSSQPVELTGNSMAGVRFLDHIKAASQPLGFFAYHSWSFIDGAVGGYFTGLDLLDSYGHTSVPIAVTEFGPTWEFGLLGGAGEPEWEPQETAHGAAFVAQVYSNIAQRCAKDGKRFPLTYAWWTLSDVFDEGYEDQGDYAAEKKPFIGAMGLLSRENIKKPAYNAYKFLAKMGDEQLSLTVDGAGNVGGMASRDTKDGGIQVILYNGQSPGAGYPDDKYYTVADAQNFGVTVSGMNPEVAYDVTAYRVDEARGNAFAAWNMAGKKDMSSMSDSDWQALQTAMESPAESVGHAQCGTTFSKTFSLSSPGVLLLTIEPSLKK